MMKKLCVFLLICLLTGFTSKATVISFLPSELPEVWNEYNISYSLNKSGIELFCNRGTVTPEHFRIYKNSFIQFTSSIGMITRIEFACVGYNPNDSFGPIGFWGEPGYYYTGRIGVWTGSSSSVSLNAYNQQVRATRINVYVEENPRVQIDKNSLELRVGDSILLHAAVEPCDILIPVEWSSSNNDVASVSSGGLVIARKAGEADITAGFENISATCHVRVLPNTKIVLNANKLQMHVDDSYVLTATILPPNNADSLIRWAIADNSIVEGIPNDRSLTINAKNVGTTIVTAYANDGSGVYETCEVTVKPHSSTAAILSVGPCHLELQPGDTAKIEAEAIPVRPLYWTSDNENVASVEDGLVTAKKRGIAKITVSTHDFFNQSLDCWVTVINPNEEHQSGDVNNDGKISIADVTALIDMLLTGSYGYFAYTDVNGDGGINISDVTALIDMLLYGSY